MVIKNVKYIFAFLVLLGCFSVVNQAVAQASWEKFGQNQMQYKTFRWKYYDSTHFRVFFYRPAEKLADHVLNEAENELSSIVQKMGGSLPRKLNIVLYNSYSDYIQTNIGVNHTSDLNDADGGRLKVSGDNLPVYFTGNHADLLKQVKQGVANVIKDNMLFGKNIKEIVKNAIRMNLPEWYTTGYVQHISNDWTPELETEVQNLISLSDTNFKFKNIAQKNQKIIGHSFWHFIETQYGPNIVSNLLYLSRFRKNVDAAIRQAVQKDAKELYKEWRTFYALDDELLTSENAYGRSLKTNLKEKFEGRYSQFYLSPNGTQLAYVIRKDGEWKIILQETDLGDSKVLVQGGYKNLDEVNDPNYPLIAWSPSGNNLVTIYPYKDKTFVRLYNTVNQLKQNKLLSKRKIERITGVCFTNNDYTLILSGIKKGKSDIFTYNFRRNRITNLTNDYFDDHSPSYVSSGNKVGVLFLSNRQDTVMNQEELKAKKYFNKDFNIYYFNQKNRATLRKVTNTKNPISSPIQYGLDKFSYIEKRNGKLVRKIVEVDNSATGAVNFKTTATHALPFNVLKHHYIPNQESVVEVIKKKGKYYVYNTKVKELEKYNAEHPTQTIEKEVIKEQVKKPRKKSAEYVTTYNQVDSTSALYNVFTKGEYAANRKKGRLVSIPKRRKKKRYITTFNPKTLSTSLDNTLLFTRYQNISYNQGGFQFPSVNGFLSFELIDILEDQKITGGIRVPSSFDGTSYFLQYANYKKRLDWKITYFHQQTRQEYDASEAPDSLFSPTNFLGKVGTEYIESNFRYPFNRANSINLSIGLRYDRVRYLASNSATIKFPNQSEYWSFMRFEYIFDNSINPLLNIRKGTRAKIFAEYQYRLSAPSTGFYQIGFDARNYTTIYKNVILASRIATGLSDGSAKLLYYLGGVDNTLIQTPGEDRGPLPDNINEYAFQTLATNLRGYRQQAFNGSSYAVINEEIRLPIYNTFFKGPLKSAFLRNLQLVTFVDLGVAWRGLLPLDRNTNLSFTDTNAARNVIASFSNKQDIMGLGYGAGVRTKLFGYFIRFDVGWNIEPTVNRKRPEYHLSMATDF